MTDGGAGRPSVLARNLQSDEGRNEGWLPCLCPMITPRYLPVCPDVMAIWASSPSVKLLFCAGFLVACSVLAPTLEEQRHSSR